MNAARSVDGWRSLFWTAFNLSANPMVLLQPNRVLAGATEAEVADLAKLASFVEAKVAINGKATAYVCEHAKCDLPTSDPSVLTSQLAKVRPY